MAEEEAAGKAQEAMEVDEGQNKSDDLKMNGNVEEANEVKNGVEDEPKVNGEEKKDTNKVTGLFKVKVSGLPRFYPLGEFKKLVKEELGLALNYVRCPKKGNPWLHLTFNTAEEQQRALKALHRYTWRRKTLSCNIVTNDAQKRKPEDGMGDDSDAKKAKLDLSVDERVLMITIPYHNIPYEEQLKKKTEELRAMVQRLGELVVRQNPALAGWAEQQRKKNEGLVFRLEEIRPSPVVDAYRNKCEFRVGLNPDTQERTVGCRLENYKDGSMGVGPADSLKHLPDRMREAVKLFQEYVRKSDKEPFSVETRQGYWRHLIVRVTCSGDVMLVVVAHPQSLTEEELTKVKDDLRDYFVNGEGRACNVSSLYFQKFTEKLVGVPLPEMEHLYGKTHLEEQMLDLVFHLSPTSYFQKCGQVFGIEYLSQNIEDAKYNAKQNDITNCEFIAGRVEDILPTLSEKITGKSVVPILDPPRAGLNQKVLAQLRRLDTVQRLVYVCSNHKAPIRNFLDLCCPTGKHAMSGHPFVPVRTVPVDVVPHTAHAQMAVLLERVDPSTLPRAMAPLTSSGRKMRGGGRGAKAGMSRGAGRGRGRGLPMPRGGGGGGRGRGVPLLRGPPMPLPPPPHRMGFGAGPPPMREPLVRPRPRGDFMDGYGPPPGSRRPRVDFSSDELTLSRYSDFRRDVEDAIDSSMGPRPLLPGPPRRLPPPVRDPLVGGLGPAATAAMLEREEMAFRAGLTRGLVRAAAGFGPPPPHNMYSPPFGPPGPSQGRFKGVGKRGGGGTSNRGRGRRGRGPR
ncbi:tRNA (Uracil-5-)-methyltransferase-like protein A [Gryllus bimaculatus]|nr:tRNA (Uracil-5-)-methyltransferase-like protein A [Gryllus bimaculatus]